jgi:hypothetical protein
MTALLTSFAQGTHAARPAAAAGNAGRYYFETDTGVLFQSSGSAWGAIAAGTITVAPTGLSGATAASRYVGATASGSPVSGAFVAGDYVIDQTGKIWICTVAGSPGTWVQTGGGTGNVVGPSSATDGHLAVFDGTTGKLLKDGGAVPAGSSGGMGPATLTPPTLASFAWVNQGATVANDSNNCLYLLATEAQNRLLVQAAPATPYTVTVGLLHWGFSGDCAACLYLCESSSGKLISLMDGYDSTGVKLSIEKWNSVSSWSNYYVQYRPKLVHVPMIWLRVTDTGTNRVAYYSPDGLNWWQYHSVGRTDFLTADQIGFGLWNGGADVHLASFLSWKVT